MYVHIGIIMNTRHRCSYKQWFKNEEAYLLSKPNTAKINAAQV